MKKYTFKLVISTLVLVSSLLSGPSTAFAADIDSGIVGLVEPRYATLRSFLATLWQPRTIFRRHNRRRTIYARLSAGCACGVLRQKHSPPVM